MKTSISLFGCCVLTDTIGFGYDDKKTDFYVKNFFFQISPLSLMLSEPIETLYDYEPGVSNDLHRKGIFCDIHKNMFEQLNENMTEYIAIDVLSICRTHLEITINERKYYLSYVESSFFGEEKLFDILERRGAVVRKVEGTQLKNYWDEAIMKFCNNILKCFLPDKIIFFKTEPASLVLRKDGCMVPLDQKFIAPEDEKLVISLFLKYIPDCHVIDELQPVFSLYDHKWGPAQHHYAKPYYEYAYKALDIITDQWPRENEQKKLQKLNKMYSERMKKIYDEAMICTANVLKAIEVRESFSRSQYNAVKTQEAYLDKVREFYDIHVPYRKPLINGQVLYEAVNINQYISMLKGKKLKYVLFGAVNDIAIRYWENFTERIEMALTEKMKFQESYIFLYDFENEYGKEVHDGTRQRMSYYCKMELTNYDVIKSCEGNDSDVEKDVFHVNIYSKGWERNHEMQNNICYAKIMINNVDYSMNGQGMNFVLFSKEDRCVVDSFYVNFWTDPELLIRRV